MHPVHLLLQRLCLGERALQGLGFQRLCRGIRGRLVVKRLCRGLPHLLRLGDLVILHLPSLAHLHHVLGGLVIVLLKSLVLLHLVLHLPRVTAQANLALRGPLSATRRIDLASIFGGYSPANISLVRLDTNLHSVIAVFATRALELWVTSQITFVPVHQTFRCPTTTCDCPQPACSTDTFSSVPTAVPLPEVDETCPADSTG